MESFESGASSSVIEPDTSDEPELKPRRKSKGLPWRHSTPLLSTQEEPVQVVEGMDVSDLVKVSEGDGSCLAITEPADQSASCCALMNEKRKLNNTVKELWEKLTDKRGELKRIKEKMKGRSYLVATCIEHIM